jgi:ribosomal protein L12E/L44/L45/RPP1/RPP2
MLFQNKLSNTGRKEILGDQENGGHSEAGTADSWYNSRNEAGEQNEEAEEEEEEEEEVGESFCFGEVKVSMCLSG